MQNQHTEPLVPLSAFRLIRRLSSEMQKRAIQQLEAIAAEGETVITVKHVNHVLSQLHSITLEDSLVEADQEMCEQAMADYEAGNWRPAEEIANELRRASA